MILKAKRNKGDSFTKDDELQVELTDINLPTGAFPLYSVEVVSGIDVTHGGGAESGVFLNYSRTDSIEPIFQMSVEQVAQGTSIIRVVADYTDDVADGIAFESAKEAYDIEYGLITDPALIPEYSPPEYISNHLTLKSGEIELTWGEDIFV